MFAIVVCLMWCGSNDAREWFTVYEKLNKKNKIKKNQHDPPDLFRLPSFCQVISIRLNQQRTLVRITTNSIKNSNFHEHQLDIQILFTMPMAFTLFALNAKMLIHVPTSVISISISLIVSSFFPFYFSIEAQLNWCANSETKRAQIRTISKTVKWYENKGIKWIGTFIKLNSDLLFTWIRLHIRLEDKRHLIYSSFNAIENAIHATRKHTWLY